MGLYGPLLDGRIGIEQAAEVIEKVRGIDGVVWIFEREYPLKRHEVDQIRERIKNWLCRRLWIAGKELMSFNINLFPDRYDPYNPENYLRESEQREREQVITVNLNFDRRSGIEIARYGFNAGYARLKELEEAVVNPSLIGLCNFSLGLHISDHSVDETTYWLEVMDVTKFLYVEKLGSEQVERLKQIQLRLVEMLKNLKFIE